MLPEYPNPAKVPCRNEQGRAVAEIQIWRARTEGAADDLIQWSAKDAEARGEEPVQLRERGRYIYRIEGGGDGWRLDGVGISQSPADGRSGSIEPGDQCGVLSLTLLKGDAVVGRGAVEVRSVKLTYREDYRGMLNFIGEKCAGLLLDSRTATRLRLSSAWRENPGLMEQQLEFLRHTLESAAFRGAVDEVLRNPHRLLEDERREQSISRPFKAGKEFARQVGRAGERVALPEGHPLRAVLPSLPAKITVTRRTDFLDTVENRFVKMVLVEFRDFLAEVAGSLGRAAETGNNARLLREVARLRGRLDALLSRGFLPDVSRPELLPLGSPVLQRKAGYRELLHAWLQFHAGAQLAWDGGAEVWQGGARNVATLYEYWLFFQLEALFREKFACTQPLHAVLVETDAGLPRLKLQRGVELKTPVGGAWSAIAKRPLKAEFQFNKKFLRNTDHKVGGSWTRGVQPDYTLSIWPAEFSKEKAEECDALAHVHFDAKYRVEKIAAMFGAADDDEVIQDHAESATAKPTAAKYADLLKMHAYRDAIRRSAGAYVLYPGNAGDGRKFEQFHELLPGLGAFAIHPKADGAAEGMGELRKFLDDVIEHLSNRTTSRERASFHTAESYTLREDTVQYGSLVLNERDVMSDTGRAIPPAEHHVVVAWYDSEAQLAWTLEKGIANVRLGKRRGTWHVPPEFASARHLLLRSYVGEEKPVLLKLKDDVPGYKIYSAADLLKAGYPGNAKGEIYAVFEVERDDAYAGREWDGAKLMELIEEFEKRRNYRGSGLGRTSPFPRVMSLRELLQAMKGFTQGAA